MENLSPKSNNCFQLQITMSLTSLSPCNFERLKFLLVFSTNVKSFDMLNRERGSWWQNDQTCHQNNTFLCVKISMAWKTRWKFICRACLNFVFSLRSTINGLFIRFKWYVIYKQYPPERKQNLYRSILLRFLTFRYQLRK